MRDGFREHRWTSADGLELYSRVYDGVAGDGPTVMCLPGLTRNSRDFEDLAPHLAGRYRVLAPDLRGRGFSARDPKWQNYHPGTYVQDALQLLDLLGVQRVALIGTSLGGLMSMIMCAVAPQRVAGVVLNDVGPEVDPAGLARIQKYAGKLPPVKSWQDAIAQTRQVYEFAWPGLPEERWPVLVRRAYRENAAGVPVPDVDPMVGEAIRSTEGAPKDLWPIYQALKPVPALALRGATSDILSVATLERMQREKPDLEVLTVPNRGHVPLLDEPECLAAIDAFLAKLRYT